MDAMLKTLCEKNPGLKLYSVLDPEFCRYGRVLNAETEELAAALAERYNEFGPCENAKFYIMPRPMLEHILGGRPLPNEDVYYMVIDGE